MEKQIKFDQKFQNSQIKVHVQLLIHIFCDNLENKLCKLNKLKFFDPFL